MKKTTTYLIYLTLGITFLITFESRAQTDERQVGSDIDTAIHTLRTRYIPVGQAGRGTGVLTEGGLHGDYEILKVISLVSDRVMVAGDFPGSVKFPRSNVSVMIGGLAFGSFDLDFNPIESDEFITAEIPIPVENDFNSRITGRKSRLWWRAAYATQSHGDITAYVEFDFDSGEEGNQPEGAPNVRGRQAWVDFWGLKMGLYYSNFTDIAVWPLIADEEGPGSFIWLRQGYVGKSFEFNNSTVTFSVETPFSDLTFAEGFEAYNPSPDYVLSYTYTRNWGHVRGAFLSRILGAESEDERLLTYAWGATFSGIIKTTGGSFFSGAVTGGEGVGRYMEDGLRIATLGGFQESANILTPIPAIGVWANYAHFWTEDLFSTFLGGYVEYFTISGMSPDTFRSSTYGLLNLVWNPLEDFAVGVEFIYGNRVNFDRQSGYSTRLSIASQYVF